ncbi:MAG: c-type cytochrome [Planctomycetota bacterium]|jgi:mono/diheme cytochrome c family protein
MAIAPAAILCALAATSGVVGQVGQGTELPDSAMEGWRVFAQKHCLQCHAVWGLGGESGPDLGRTEQQHLTAGRLVGTMWNHIPKVYSLVIRNQLEYPRLTSKEMSELYGFLFLVRYLDEPGNPDAGQLVLRQKGCASCHSTEGNPQSGAPDLRRWARYANPIVWAHKMWEHAPRMEREMQQAGITWPTLDDTDLMNIIAYLRSVGGHEAKVYLEPGSARTGARLFADRECQGCHHSGGVGPDFSTTAPPRSVAALASRMWNHSPDMSREMKAQGVERSPLTVQEMADIIAYIISLHYEDSGGDPQRGRVLFEQKRCAECHTEEEPAESRAPALAQFSGAADPLRLAPAMWNHGVTMMQRISDLGDVWPVFQPDEMVDLIAYFEAIASAEAAVSAAVPARTPPAEAVTRATGPPIEAGATCVSNTCHPGVMARATRATP